MEEQIELGSEEYKEIMRQAYGDSQAGAKLVV